MLPGRDQQGPHVEGCCMKTNLEVDDRTIRICLVHSVYKEIDVKIKDENGNVVLMTKQKLLKQIPVRKWMKKESVSSVEEYVTAKNTVSKSRSILFDRDSGRFYATYHNPDDLWKAVVSRHPFISENPTGFTLK